MKLFYGAVRLSVIMMNQPSIIKLKETLQQIATILLWPMSPKKLQPIRVLSPATPAR